jgi:Flp pilus assembly protein TadG
MLMHRRPADAHDDQRGDATIMVIILVTSLLLIMGLVVDGSRLYRANDEARWLAEQAARAAAQQIDASQVQQGDRPVIDLGPAAAEAQRVLADAGATGSLERTADGLRVETTVTTTPIVLQIAGVSTLTGTGEATVRLARGIEDGNA